MSSMLSSSELLELINQLQKRFSIIIKGISMGMPRKDNKIKFVVTVDDNTRIKGYISMKTKKYSVIATFKSQGIIKV